MKGSGMVEHVGLVLTEAIEDAARAVAKQLNVEWDNCDQMMKLRIREIAIVPVRAAAPSIVAQVLSDIAHRTYDIE